MRVAWFSPLPPARSGIAAYSADILPRLASAHRVDAFVDVPDSRAGSAEVFPAHEFVWRHRLDPYDLVVYQLGNARCHDYMWAYLSRYPGLVVLHDARLHHARARQLLQQQRFDDYRAEFRFDHPGAPQDFTEYAVEGLGGPVYYFWSMLRSVVASARAVAVHNSRVAADLRAEFPGAAVDVIRMGVPPGAAPASARASIRRTLQVPDDAIVFAAFGKVTAEKRISTILRAMARLKAGALNVFGLLVGDADGYPLASEIAALAIDDRVRITGYVPDDEVGAYLAAADVCLCLRWPTALETSASWLRCLAAGKPTVISDLAQLCDVPADVARRIDLLDEERALAGAMGELASNPQARAALASAGHEYWIAHHTIDHMAADYGRVLRSTLDRPAPAPANLPAHLRADHTALARAIARDFGVAVDLFQGVGAGAGRGSRAEQAPLPGGARSAPTEG